MTVPVSVRAINLSTNAHHLQADALVVTAFDPQFSLPTLAHHLQADALVVTAFDPQFTLPTLDLLHYNHILAFKAPFHASKVDLAGPGLLHHILQLSIVQKATTTSHLAGSHHEVGVQEAGAQAVPPYGDKPVLVWSPGFEHHGEHVWKDECVRLLAQAARASALGLFRMAILASDDFINGLPAELGGSKVSSSYPIDKP
jgi:hypothetical protein